MSNEQYHELQSDESNGSVSTYDSNYSLKSDQKLKNIFNLDRLQQLSQFDNMEQDKAQQKNQEELKQVQRLFQKLRKYQTTPHGRQLIKQSRKLWKKQPQKSRSRSRQKKSQRKSKTSEKVSKQQQNLIKGSFKINQQKRMNSIPLNQCHSIRQKDSSIMLETFSKSGQMTTEKLIIDNIQKKISRLRIDQNQQRQMEIENQDSKQQFQKMNQDDQNQKLSLNQIKIIQTISKNQSHQKPNRFKLNHQLIENPQLYIIKSYEKPKIYARRRKFVFKDEKQRKHFFSNAYQSKLFQEQQKKIQNQNVYEKQKTYLIKIQYDENSSQLIYFYRAGFYPIEDLYLISANKQSKEFVSSNFNERQKSQCFGSQKKERLNNSIKPIQIFQNEQIQIFQNEQRVKNVQFDSQNGRNSIYFDDRIAQFDQPQQNNDVYSVHSFDISRKKDLQDMQEKALLQQREEQN